MHDLLALSLAILAALIGVTVIYQLNRDNPMTEDEAIKALKECQNDGDTEAAHSNADDILCALLKELGYQNVVDEWNKVPKWYA